ncbi:helix-turn-helix transcriptional regulator [Sphingobacterium gobiense]|uniref:HTH luxR-type domain-containing protein n=1 Tax=Sphingobacterium gobiense TaxID=1382456 RepID=A0A2S9JMD6_9SPHI|nr:hypothetical protein [Sphingobacterium gobiense]PRD54323.1 hypothetical protein C5749_12710 [Sphingobacterium gobiense]
MYRKTGKYKLALIESHKALHLAQTLNEAYQIESAYRDIGKAHHLLGRNDSAYHYMEKSRRYARQLYSKENSQQTSFYQVLYDLEEKEDRITQLNNIKRISIVIATAVLVIAFLLFRFQTSKINNERSIRQKNNDLLQTQNKLIKAELANKELAEQALKKELEAKSHELSSKTLYVISKNQFLESLRKDLTTLLKEDKRDNKKQLKRIIVQINQSFNNDKYWEDFRTAVEKVHGDFYQRLQKRSPDLKSNDLRLIALLRMNFSTEEIATLLGISIDSARVARYRLRKKLHLHKNENLTTFLQNL